MRNAAQSSGDVKRMQAWAGQSAGRARAEPAGDLAREIWQEARALLALSSRSHGWCNALMHA
jgi:nitronate monooxygenase